MDKKDNKKRF